MELQLVKKYDARAWDGVVVPLGEGNLTAIRVLGSRSLPQFVPRDGLKGKPVRFSAFLFFQRAC